jgi:hypothetical protein
MRFLRSLGGQQEPTAEAPVPQDLLPTTAVIETVANDTAGSSASFRTFQLGLLVTPPNGGEAYHAECSCQLPAAVAPFVKVGTQMEVLVDAAHPQQVFLNRQHMTLSSVVTNVSTPMGSGEARTLTGQEALDELKVLQQAMEAGLTNGHTSLVLKESRNVNVTTFGFRGIRGGGRLAGSPDGDPAPGPARNGAAAERQRDRSTGHRN